MYLTWIWKLLEAMNRREDAYRSMEWMEIKKFYKLASTIQILNTPD